MIFSKIISITLGLLLVKGLYAQQTPAPPQTTSILITNATIYTQGKKLEGAAIAFSNGKIDFVGNQNIPTGYEKIIDAKGKNIYPGLIAPNTQLGLREISAVRATADYVEVEAMNPSVRSIIAYNTDSKVTPTVRSNGVLIAEIAPTGRVISGRSSIVQLDAWNWEDAVISEDNGIHLHWPARYRRASGRGEARRVKPNEQYSDQVAQIKSFFEDAKAYQKRADYQEKNLKLEACRTLFGRKAKLYIHTHDAPSMMEAVLMAEDLHVQPVIVGAADAHLILPFLQEHHVQIILANTQRLPRFDDSDIDQPYKLAGQLEKAGILFGFGIDGYWQQRNLAFQAGQAVAYGLDYKKAIDALTINTAKILGIDHRLGSLEVGKDATFIITNGDVLDMRNSILSSAYISGRKIDLDNKQKALNKKFRNKYGI